ncbi:hypothetical protein SK128_014550 [Halocaridina rubra]|uniref:Aminopeptidase n=1 Tax=Halocaridina rubra TaxID=373956 RepID=A0AAN8WZL8_HALRR
MTKKSFIPVPLVILLSLTGHAANTSNDSPAGMVILPKTLKPLHYDVWLQPFINGNFSIYGRAIIEFEVLAPTYHVILHMTDIITKNESTRLIDNASKREIVILQQLYVPTRNLYIAHLEEKLEAGRSFILSLEFKGTLGEQPRGFYRSSYKKENGHTSWVAATQFQSTDARRAFPCFDEPGLKATFKIFLARETHMKALSNMPLVKSTPIENQPGWWWDEFEKSVPMSTYLVAFYISDFSSKIINDGSNGTMFRAVTRSAIQLQTQLAGEIGIEVLSFYEQYFSMPFPLPKIDMIAVPENSFSAMENWGLITFRESGLLYSPISSPAKQKKWVSYLVSHELAHQWFGNLVTMEWWTDLWLNEGFATYMGDKAVDHIEPEWHMMDLFIVHRQQIVMALDALKSSHPVSVAVHDPVEINEIFDQISYLKGASIIRMMSYFLTESTFKKGLKNYLTTLKYKNADQDDLWHFLTEAAHEDGTLSTDQTVKTIMDTWTLKEGFPVISVTRAGNSSAILTQEQFLLDTNATERTSNKWWIPITYTSQENPSFRDTQVKFWLNDRGIDPVSYIGYPEPHHWVIFNIQQSGYYRVNYDTENWRLLTQQLLVDHEIIHVNNRAQIIDDALNLARIGQLSYDVALEITAYLKKERHYVPWKAAFNNLQYIYDMLQQDPVFGALREYLLSLILPLYNHIGFDEQQGDELQVQLLRSEMVKWACLLRHQDCLQRSVSLFRRWMSNPNEEFNGVSPNVADTVYCTAIREGEEPEWMFAWEKKLSGVLSCTTHFWLIARYLKGAFNESSGIRRQDASLVFQQVSKNSNAGNILAWDYMRTNWKQITDYIGSTFFALANMMEEVTKTFNSEQKVSELIQFQKDNDGNLLTATRAVTQALEATRLNMAWMKDNYDTIVHWLKSHEYSSELLA